MAIQIVSLLAGLTAAYIAWGITYRLFLHPLARVPGPTLAALTSWYEFYIDTFVDGGGKFDLILQKWHKQYGPVIRVSPNEVHVDDPHWLRILYAQGKIRERDPSLANAFGSTHGTFGTVDHHQHRQRRASLSAFFSKRAVGEHAHLIQASVNNLCTALQEHYDRHGTQPIDFRPIIHSWSIDSVTSLIFNREFRSVLSPVERAANWRLDDAIRKLWPLVRQCLWIVPVVLNNPDSSRMLVSILLPPLIPLVDLWQDMQRMTKEAVESGKLKNTLFDPILASKLPDSEKTVWRMSYEALEVYAAGLGTSARIINFVLYHCLANPAIYQRVMSEVNQIMPDKNEVPDPIAVTQLPYLTAVAKETLRISSLVRFRSAVRAPEDVLQYEHYSFPPGTTISMTPATVLVNPAIYENPDTFMPERWLPESSSPEKLAMMEAFYTPFGLGNRRCIGTNYAYAQTQTVLLVLFRRFEMELFEVIRERDIDHSRAWAVGEPSKSSPGMRLKLTPRSK